MHLLGKGKESFLEFLRNLSPQIFITAAATVLQVTLGKFDNTFEWYKHAALIGILWLTWVAAMVANISNFIEKFTETIDEYQELDQMADYGFLKRIGFLWKTRKSLFFEALVLLVVVTVSMLTVMISSIFSSAGALKTLHIDIG